jgi:hypothetical protein
MNAPTINEIVTGFIEHPAGEDFFEIPLDQLVALTARDVSFLGPTTT